LKTQRSHALADRVKIVGGPGCVGRHNCPMIILPRQILVLRLG
jgi:hypothetical protein